MKLNPVGSNQTEIETEKFIVLFSYKTPVAYQDKETGKSYKTSTKWSVTTSKHINQAGYKNAEPVDQSVLDNLLK